MGVLRALRGFLPRARPRSGPVREEDGGSVAGSVPVAIATFAAMVISLVDRLQDAPGGREETYRQLEGVLSGSESRLQRSVVDRVLAAVSAELRAAQDVTAAVRTAASDVLVALARCHLREVVSALQEHLRSLQEMSGELVLLTLRNVAARYALQCVPFAGATLSTLHSVLGTVRSGRMLRAVCGVVEQWCRAVDRYLHGWEKRASPRLGAAQLGAPVQLLFCHVGQTWQRCKEDEEKQAVLRAMGAMMGVLLRAEKHREQAWQRLPWLLHHYREVRDPAAVTTSLGYVLAAAADVRGTVPRVQLLAISAAVHEQLCDETEPPGAEHRAELCRCVVLQAQICPEEVIVFLQCKLRNGSKADRAAAVQALQALLCCDIPNATENVPLMVKMAQSVCHDPAVQVRRAVLRFIGELLHSDAVGCSSWDAVGHIFIEFSRSADKLASGRLCEEEAQDEKSIQRLCRHILGTLDVSSDTVTKLLWPKLLQFVVPAPYTGLLAPLCRCLCALAERQRGGERDEEQAALELLRSEEPGALLAPQALLVRLLVVSALTPHAGGGHGAAALQLLLALRGVIHGSVRASWAAEIPALLQQLAGTSASCLDTAQWESLLLKFLRTSLTLIADDTWVMELSQELMYQLGRSARLSWEKRFLYKALGTALAACGRLRFVREQILRHLQRADFLELWEAQGMVSVVSRCAEGHFHLALRCVEQLVGALRPEKRDVVKARATRAALMVIYGRVALRAPKEELLACVGTDIVGNVLRLYREGCQDAQLKLSLVQSVTEISAAIQAAGPSPSFELCRKRELLQTLLEVIQEEPQESPVQARAIVALGELSKLKPRASRMEKCSLLSRCCEGIVSLRRPEQTQGVQASSLRALRQLSASVLWAEPAPMRLQDVGQVLQRWLTSPHVCERDRALQVCEELLGAHQEGREQQRGRPCEQLGSLAGLLGPLTSDTCSASRQRAASCLGRLLPTGAHTMDMAAERSEMGWLQERLGTTASKPLVVTSNSTAELVCKVIPQGQAADFMSSIVERLLRAGPEGVWAAGRWMLTFVGPCAEHVLQEEVPQLVHVLCSCLQSTQCGPRRRLVLQALCLLARCHQPAVLESLLQERLPTDSNMREVWRSLGRSALGSEILMHLAEKLRRAGKSSREGESCLEEVGSSQAAAEPRTISHALLEVVCVLRSKSVLQDLLPELLPALLEQVSEALGEDMVPSPGETSGEDPPGRLFVCVLELVLSKCLDEQWLRLLREQGAWASLSEPQAHCAGVFLLASVLLRAELVPQRLLQRLLPWLGSSSGNLRLTATAFFAELMKEPAVRDGKLLKPLLEAFRERCGDPVSTVRQVAVRGLGNLAMGLSGKLRRHGAALLEMLLRSLENGSSAEAAAESLQVLAKVVGQLPARAMGSALAEVCRATRAFLGAEAEVLRRSAFALYGALALSARSRRTLFCAEVEEIFASLVLHLRDPAPSVCSACKVTLHLCAPFLPSRTLQGCIASSIGLKAGKLQEEICRHVARECPALLERLFSTARNGCTGSYEASQASASVVLGILVESAPAKWLRQQDLPFLPGARQRRQRARGPCAPQAAAPE
ncbi:maestro heat-like repeat-containing protein family member 2B [Eudromia elegans]